MMQCKSFVDIPRELDSSTVIFCTRRKKNNRFLPLSFKSIIRVYELDGLKKRLQKGNHKLILAECDFSCDLTYCARLFRLLIEFHDIPNALVRLHTAKGLPSDLKPLSFLSFLENEDSGQLSRIFMEETNKNATESISQKIHPYMSRTQKIISVQNEVMRNPIKKNDLCSLSKNIRMSSSWLAHNFDKYSNLELSKFRQKTRCCLALWLLLSTDGSIKSIAADSGYGVLSFSRAFKRNFGTTASQFRSGIVRF
jgi:AraC-like DNA-binding protein